MVTSSERGWPIVFLAWENKWVYQDTGAIVTGRRECRVCGEYPDFPDEVQSKRK